MKVLLPLSAFLLLTTAACQSSSWNHRSAKVDDAYLARVSDGDRKDIADLRATHAETEDEVIFASRRIDEEQTRKKIAEQEVDIAEQEVDRAEARLDIAEKNGEKLEDAREQLDAAHAHVRWAQAQVAYHEMLIDQAKAERELAEQRCELSQARVELRKAQAISEIDETGIPDIDLAPFEQDVEEAEMDVKLAEIELDAMRKKADARQALVERRAEDTPKELRASWRSTYASEASSKKNK